MSGNRKSVAYLEQQENPHKNNTEVEIIMIKICIILSVTLYFQVIFRMKYEK